MLDYDVKNSNHSFKVVMLYVVKSQKKILL